MQILPAPLWLWKKTAEVSAASVLLPDYAENVKFSLLKGWGAIARVALFW